MPIDEMLMELRAKLEAFEANPNDEGFAAIQRETSRIENECEELLEQSAS